MIFLRLFPRTSYNLDFFCNTSCPRFRRSFSTCRALVKKRRQDLHLRVSADGLNWVEALLSQHVPDLEVRRAPNKAGVSFFVRFRDERCRYNPDVTWQALILRSTDGPRRQGTSSPMCFTFNFGSKQSAPISLRAGLLLISPSDRLMYIMEPTPLKSFRIPIAGNSKHSDKLVHPEKDPSTFRQRIFDLLRSDAVIHRTWCDSVDAVVTRKKPSLLPELVSLSPFLSMEFCNDPLTVISGHLHGQKIVLRTLTSSRIGEFGAYTFCFHTNLLRGHGLPYQLSDDFDWFLFLVPNAASSEGKALRRIGLVPKQLLCERGIEVATVEVDGGTAGSGCGDRAAKIHSDLFFERGVWKAGKFRFGAWKAGELEGTVLPGLEDYFIDVDVPPDELGAFVERHLSLNKTKTGVFV